MSTSAAMMAASLSPAASAASIAVDRAGGVAEPEARFVEHEVVHVAGAGGGTHGAVGAVGVTPQGDGCAAAVGDGFDDGGDVVEVPLDRVARCRRWRRSRGGPWSRWSSRVAGRPRRDRRWCGRRWIRARARAVGRSPRSTRPATCRRPSGHRTGGPTLAAPGARRRRVGRRSTSAAKADNGVREGVGLLGVGDVAAVGELDEPCVGQRGRQPVRDRSQRWVAGVAGQDQGGQRHGLQVIGRDVERR